MPRLDVGQGAGITHRRVLLAHRATGDKVAGKEDPMTRRFWAWSVLLGLLLALNSPTAASARAETTTTHFSDTASSPDANPCNGAPGTSTDTVRGVTHLTELADGSFHQTTTVTDTFSFVPNDPSQPSYTGKSTFRTGANLSSQNNFTSTITLNAHAEGSDGSRVTFHVVGHVTLHPDGTITVEFEKMRLSCR
jgi:hypothetical protein